MAVKDGFGAPYIRLFHGEKELEVSPFVDAFIFTLDEEDDDEITFTVKLGDRSDVDKPEWQEKAELRLVWGYIGGETSNERKVYIRNAKPHFTKEGIELSLECTEKAAVMKGATERSILSGGLVGTVIDKANKHGLKAEAHVALSDKDHFDVEPLEPIPGESTNDFTKRIHRARLAKAAGRKANILELNDFQWKKGEGAVPADRWNTRIDQNTQFIAQARSEEMAEKLEHDRMMAAAVEAEKQFKLTGPPKVPQAGKSDMQVVKDMAKRVRGGAIVETRDDRIIIRRRDFNQAPYRSYEYGAPDGILLDFMPETRNRQRAGSGMGMNYQGWNPLNKSIYSGTTNAANDPFNRQLANVNEMIRAYKFIEAKGGAGTFVGWSKARNLTHYDNPPAQPAVPVLGPDGKITLPSDNRPRQDKTYNLTWQREVVQHKVTVTEHRKALEAERDRAIAKKDAAQKEIYSSLGLNPDGSMVQAANRRSNQQLETNPATAQLWGDPGIEPGMIVTILGVGQKHSGNYYVKRVTHSIDKTNGYTTELELRKHGHNIKTNDDQVFVEELDKQSNNLIGDTDLPEKTKTLKVKSNGTKTT